MAEDHPFLQVLNPKPNPRTVRPLVVDLMDTFTGQKLSRTQWLKREPAEVLWRESEDSVRHSRPLSVGLLERHLADRGTLDHQELGLPEPKCFWLDEGFSFGLNNAHMQIRSPQPIGPIVPAIDREGYLCQSFQPIVQREILAHWQWLSATSDEFANDDWTGRLRLLFSACVSLVDMTLHQIRAKAEIDPDPGWLPIRGQLGPHEGQRVSDKFGWMYRITGQHLPNLAEERRAFDTIRQLRNHTQHFDPPCFCFTVEEVAGWLNSVPLIARLAWALRRHVGASLSEPLIRLLLLPEVVLVPRESSKQRPPLTDEFGYRSSIWPPGYLEQISAAPD